MADALPVVPHMAGELYLWIWWLSDIQGGQIDIGGDVGRVELFVDERLAFRAPQETKVSAVLTGERASDSVESRAAVWGGKVLQEVRLRIVRDDRQFLVTLKGPEVHLTGLKLPQALKDSQEEAIYDRMFLYEELCFVVGGLLRDFAQLRTSSAWEADVVPRIKAWVGERPLGGEE